MGQFIGGLPLINLLGDSDGLGVTVFSNSADVLTPVTPLGPKRQDVLNLINQISASGNTLLFDTIAAQFDALNKLPSKHIKAVIVLTDGMDNISQHSLDQLVSQITPVGENAGNSIKVFTIAYGSDADVSGLTKIANATAGQEYAGTPQNIKQVQGARCIYKSQIADQRILLTNRSMPALLRTSSRCKVQGAFTNRKSQITNHKSQISAFF